MRGICEDCGAGPTLHAKARCRPCYWRAHREAVKERCPRCGELGNLRPSEGGVCGWCVRRGRPRTLPTPRACRRCGRVREHAAHGLCGSCYQADPAGLEVWLAGAIGRLGDRAPWWFADIALDLGRGHPSRAEGHLRSIEMLLAAGVDQPGAIVAALRTPGRSPGATARLAAEFFERAGLGRHLDEATRLAAGRRQRLLDRIPDRMRPGAAAFADHLLRGRARAVLHGGRGLADRTIEVRLGDLGTLARYLADRGISDWAVVSNSTLEAFVNLGRPGSRLPTLRAFFAFAKRRKLVLGNPAAGLQRVRPRGFSGRVLTLAEQRALLRRWTGTEAAPLERAIGFLCLLHGTSSAELRHLRLDAIDLEAGSVRLGHRRHPLPLDPLTADAIRACVAQRTIRPTINPHLVVTKVTRLHEGPCSEYFLARTLKATGFTPRVVRQTRLADLAQRTDPRLLAASFGLTEEGALHYVRDSIDAEEVVFAATEGRSV